MNSNRSRWILSPPLAPDHPLGAGVHPPLGSAHLVVLQGLLARHLRAAGSEIDPQSKLMAASIAAINRAQDDRILAAFFGDSITGPTAPARPVGFRGFPAPSFP